MQLEACRDVITQVRPYLFVSGAGPAQTRTSLKAAGITHVVNCSSTSLNVRFEDIHYAATWNILDSKRQSLNQYFYPFIAAVEDCCREGGRLLVHCHVGASRSCALAIAYLMWREGLAFVEALQDLKQRRSVCNPNVGFMAQLIELEARLCRQRNFARAVQEHGPAARGESTDHIRGEGSALPHMTTDVPLLLVHPVSFVDSEHEYLVSLPAEPLPSATSAVSTPGDGPSVPTTTALDPNVVYVLGVWDPQRAVRQVLPQDTAQSLPNPCTYFIWIGALVAAANRDAQVAAAKDAVGLFQSLSLTNSDPSAKSVQRRGSLVSTPQVVTDGAEPVVLKQLVQQFSDGSTATTAEHGGHESGSVRLDRGGGSPFLKLQRVVNKAVAQEPRFSRSQYATASPNSNSMGRDGDSGMSSDDDDDDDGDSCGPVELFQLNEEAVWEHFKIYSYDDLCSRSCVLRDPAAAKLYCWVCEDDQRMDALSLVDSFRKQLPQKCCFSATSQKAPALDPFQVEKEHAESAAFLDAFNSGL